MLVAPFPFIPHNFPTDESLQEGLEDLNALEWKFVDCLYMSSDYGLLALGRGCTRRGKTKYMRMVWSEDTPLKEGTPIPLVKGFHVKLYSVSRENGKILKEKKNTVSRRDKGVFHRYAQRLDEAFEHNISALEAEIAGKPSTFLEHALVSNTRALGARGYAHNHVYYKEFLRHAGIGEPLKPPNISNEHDGC